MVRDVINQMARVSLSLCWELEGDVVEDVVQRRGANTLEGLRRPPQGAIGDADGGGIENVDDWRGLEVECSDVITRFGISSAKLEEES